MRSNGIVPGIALLMAMLFGISVAAANPAITVSATRRDASGAVVALLPVTDTQGNVVPPLALLGDYVIASGQGFPPNQPVQASLVAHNQSYPLAYQDLTTAGTASQPIPMTDGTGAFRNLAFTLPAPGQIVDTSGEIFVSAGTATARAPIAIDSGIATTAGRGDKIAVSIGAAFFAVAVLLILLLVRGLPVYPVGQTTARRVRETEIP
ncbi:MAG: hypothetical protein M3Y58_21380 [Chloroflexota bacterium]|nr:hypothetical protein [Chloroflexota bacterium]